MKLTQQQKETNVGLLCGHFIRNLACYRAGLPANTSSQFWIRIHNNFIDMAVLDWCKLFADRKGIHHWKQVLGAPEAFLVSLLKHLNLKTGDFDNYIKSVRHYRDKFLAHLDDENIMNIPRMDIAYKSTNFYFANLPVWQGNVGTGLNFAEEQYQNFLEEATKEIHKKGTGFPPSSYAKASEDRSRK